MQKMQRLIAHYIKYCNKENWSQKQQNFEEKKQKVVFIYFI